jgi:hypothetical protein
MFAFVSALLPGCDPGVLGPSIAAERRAQHCAGAQGRGRRHHLPTNCRYERYHITYYAYLNKTANIDR